MGGSLKPIVRDGLTVKEAYNSTSPGVQTVGPIKHKEYRRMGTNVEDRVNKLETRMNMAEQSLASIDTVLLGRDGKGGAIERLEQGQEKLLEMMQGVNDTIKGITSMHVTDIGQLDDKITANKHAIENINKDACSGNAKIDKHLEEHKTKDKDAQYKKGARQWDLMKTLITFGSSFLLAFLLFKFGIG